MKTLLKVAATMSLLAAGCHGTALKVSTIGKPDYPIRARVDGIQGKVVVGVEVGTGGVVVSAKGSGGDSVLVTAAESNARDWVFGPFPNQFSFPVYHEITYVFRLEGTPVTVATEPPDVKTRLPDRIEIIAPPIRANKFTVLPSHP
jgi:TonB family protein